jgi:hypothetical protein
MLVQPRFLSHCIARTARRSPRTLCIQKLTPFLQLHIAPTTQRTFSTTTTNMSGFSNADTGSKNADPYIQKNLEEPSLKEKAEDLLNFVDKTKFCLLTTQVADSDLLASRAMALAAKVWYSQSIYMGFAYIHVGRTRFRLPLPHQHRVWQDRRPSGAQVRQHRLHQQLRRVGIHLRPRLHRDRPRSCPQALLARAEGMDWRPR